MSKNIFLAIATWLLLGTSLWAHEDAGMAGGFISGLTHPLFGFDHVVAMIAVAKKICLDIACSFERS